MKNHPSQNAKSTIQPNLWNYRSTLNQNFSNFEISAPKITKILRAPRRLIEEIRYASHVRRERIFIISLGAIYSTHVHELYLAVRHFTPCRTFTFTTQNFLPIKGA